MEFDDFPYFNKAALGKQNMGILNKDENILKMLRGGEGRGVRGYLNCLCCMVSHQQAFSFHEWFPPKPVRSTGDECFRTSEESVAMRNHAAVGFERGDVKKG